MLIIMDGCDNTGKSSIGLALSKAIDCPYLKYSNITKDNIDKDTQSEININSSIYGLSILNALGNPNIIIDRQYPSEYAYGKVFRNTKFHDIEFVDSFLSKNFNKHLIIITEKSINIQKENDFVLCKHYEELKEAYRDFAKRTSAKCIILDTTDQDLYKQLEKIFWHLDEQRFIRVKRTYYNEKAQKAENQTQKNSERGSSRHASRRLSRSKSKRP